MTVPDRPSLFERQGLHWAMLATLAGAAALAGRADATRVGAVAGVSASTLLQAAVGTAIAHQIYVWWGWRLELLRGSLTRWWGPRAFEAFAAGFLVLGISRAALVCALAVANRGTLPIDPVLGRAIALVLLLPAGYLLYSVGRFFGLARAVGLDHFGGPGGLRPLVREGIFRWTPNAMYVFGFLWLWLPAFWFASSGALVAAAFNHAAIWAHFHCTEKPDMRRIYGAGGSGIRPGGA